MNDGERTIPAIAVRFPRGDDRRLAIQYLEPAALRALYRAPVDDPVRHAWDQVIKQLQVRTGLPVEVVDEDMPTADQKAAWAAAAANVKIIFKRRPERD